MLRGRAPRSLLPLPASRHQASERGPLPAAASGIGITAGHAEPTFGISERGHLDLARVIFLAWSGTPSAAYPKPLSAVYHAADRAWPSEREGNTGVHPLPEVEPTRLASDWL